MRLLNRTVAAACLGFGALSAVPAQADIFNGFNGSLDNTIGRTIEMLPEGFTGFKLGLGPVVEPRFVGDKGVSTRVAPVVSVRYKNVVAVDNNAVRVNVLGNWGNVTGNETWSAGPVLRIDFGRSEDESPKLAGLGDIGTSLELGGYVGYTMGPMRFKVRVRQDTTGGHHGLLVDGSANAKIISTERMTVSANIAVTWANSKFMNSFFGVTALQSMRSGLPIYNAGSGLHDVSFDVVANYVLNDRWSVLGNLGFTRLMSSASGSPLVKLRGSANQPSVAAFAIYSF